MSRAGIASGEVSRADPSTPPTSHVLQHAIIDEGEWVVGQNRRRNYTTDKAASEGKQPYRRTLDSSHQSERVQNGRAPHELIHNST